jgi:phthiocerol/phenolphthiocerol synthesis type-I polyketide synthase E
MSMASDIEPIAIIGMALRVPGARTVAEFWRNIVNATESITWFSDEELRASGVPDRLLARRDYVKASAVIPDIELFDAEFFGFTPAEAAMLDPQHRLFMECAWEALEDAGHDPHRSDVAIGIYGGCFMNKYLPLNLYTNDAFLRSSSAYFARNYNDKDFLAGRVAYLMNLRGPAVTVQTACSTSLVATHLATQALLSYECDMALVGGVAVNLPSKTGYLAVEGTMFSPTGQCRPFDAAGQGTLFGSGAGFVVLRRLRDALADGDHVRAVIRGTAINNDGINKVSFTAPSAQAQTAVIASAQSVASVSPDTIGYVEAHGTGTSLGDPIEIAALTDAFRAGTRRKAYCALGSVKANIGHLDAAAGVLGLIRAALALEHECIPPQANFESPNPQLNLSETPFYVPTKPIPWGRGQAPRRAGVSSFGVGGTNAHVVLEEAPGAAGSGTAEERASDQLLVLSARTEAGLEAACDRLATHLEESGAPALSSVAATLAEGRREFAVRRFVVCADAHEAVRNLRAPGASSPADQVHGREVIFMFPGVGTQYPDMALEIYAKEAVFREHVDACASVLAGKLDMDIRRFLFPSKFAGPAIDAESVPHVLAAIFTIEYSLARLWMAWGVQPVGMVGHSLGEYVAACLAGVLSLADALDLTVRRGQIFNDIPDGRMMGVPLPADEVLPLLSSGLSLGAVNAPSLCMVSGRQAALDLLHASLTARGVPCRSLPIRMASHSSLVEPFLADFERTVGRYRLSAPRIPYTSCVSGTWIRETEATDPAYWARQLRAPVQFMAMVAAANDGRGRVLLEVGPGTTLTTLAAAQRFVPAPITVASMRRPDAPVGDIRCLLGAAGRLWQLGVPLDWKAVRGHDVASRVPLPTYPFQRRRHWVAPGYPTGPGFSPQSAGASIALLPESAVEESDVPTRDGPGAGVTLSADERTIAGVWKDVLGIEQLGLDDDFTSLGGHSLLAAQVMMQLRPFFECSLSVVDLFAAPTVRTLAALIGDRVSSRAGAGSSAAVDLAGEVALDPGIATNGLAPMHDGPHEAVLLTGATGFLGAYLLSELLRQSRAKVYCLVRGRDADEGERRLRAQLDALELPAWQHGRVTVVPGDLEHSQFGLSEGDFDALALAVDAIYHCGAWVNFARPYAVLKNANVGGTQEVLRLAATVRLKPVHHVSTIFVTMGAMADRVAQISEDDPLPPPHGHDTGYTESKWVAEGLCGLAASRGIPVAIYRPGNLLGDTRTGVANHEDYLTRVIQACVQLGVAPQRNYPLPMGPVDDVARAIVAVSLNPGSTGRTYHVIQPDPLPWNRIFEGVRSFGHDVESIAWNDWCKTLMQELEAGRENALAALADMVNAPPDRYMPRFDVEHTRQARMTLGLSYPSLDAGYFERFLDHLTRSRLLPQVRESA